MTARRIAGCLGPLLILMGFPVWATVAAHNTAVYQGSIGAHAIVMKLPTDPAKAGPLQASYFFTRYRIDTRLDIVAFKNGQLQLTAEARESPGFKLTRQPNGGWQGTWTDHDGRTLPVKLHLATLPPLPANASGFLQHAREHAPYVYLRLVGLSLTRGAQEQFMGYTLQWWHDPGSRIAFFEITDGYPAEQRQRINSTLKSELWREVDNYYGCAGAYPAGGSVEFSATPTLLNAAVVSIKTIDQYYCGGAHGGTAYSAINLDAKTGKPLKLGDVFDVGKKGPFRYIPVAGQGNEYQFDSPNGKRFDQYVDQQQQIFVPWLVQQFKALYPAQMQGKQGDCNYTGDADTWAFEDWYLTPKGIFFIPSFPHVVAACASDDDWSLLPYARITKEGGHLKLPLPGRARATGYKTPVHANADHSRPGKLTLDKGEQQSFMGFTLQWWYEPGSGIRMFQVVGSHDWDWEMRNRVNAALMDRLWQAVGRYYLCASSSRTKPIVRVQPTFLNDWVASADMYISTPGAFANQGDPAQGCDLRDSHTPINLYVGNGMPLSQADVFRVSDLLPLPTAGQWDTANWLVKQFKGLYPQRMSGIEPVCNFADPHAWVSAKWYLTPKGIFFQPDFSPGEYLIYPCAVSDDWSLLPWASLKAHPGRLPLDLP